MTRAMERHKNGEARVIPVILRLATGMNSRLGQLLAAPTDVKRLPSGLIEMTRS